MLLFFVGMVVGIGLAIVVGWVVQKYIRWV